ncbi:glycosyltransferase [Phocaeicola coprophilus]|jgi:glycosyltransferase involved in cell wall biosynthesis|uniref:glycosyltransferase n=1 Tax=Phocaeicola coprophilus TaxID=387090 RepID=UPI003AAFF320
MNILYFFEYAPDPQRGGASRLTHSFINYWQKAQKDFSFFCAYLKREKDYIPYFKDEILLDLNKKNTFIDFLNKNQISLIIYQMAFSKVFFEFIKECNQNNIPIITVYHSMPGWELLHISNTLKCVSWNQAKKDDFIKKLFLPLYLKHINKLISKRNLYIYNGSSKYILLSNKYIPIFKKINHLRNDSKLQAISNPLSFPEQKNVNFQEKKAQVLIVGRFSESEKRFLLALKVWKEFNNQNISNRWELIIVGFGKDENIYKEYVRRNKLSNVKFVGKQDPFEYYKKASIFLMTSAFEGFPLTLIEAQQLGVVPIVMDSFPSLHDIIINDYNGIIVNNNDVKAMCLALKDLTANQEKRKYLAVNGLSYINKFSVANIAQQWEDLFSKFK